MRVSHASASLPVRLQSVDHTTIYPNSEWEFSEGDTRFLYAVKLVLLQDLGKLILILLIGNTILAAIYLLKVLALSTIL